MKCSALSLHGKSYGLLKLIDRSRAFALGATIGIFFLASALQAATTANVQTPRFKDTVDLSLVSSSLFGIAGVDYTRTNHPLDHLAGVKGKGAPHPLAQIRRIAFALRLESEVRLYRVELSPHKQALLEAVSFYNGLLEHSHRLANRSVRVCAYHLGLPYQKLAHHTITVAGPLPQSVEDYQRWATQPDPPPCLRDVLWSEPEAEKTTRYHHLKRMTQHADWSRTPTQLKWDVEREVLELKNELDGSMFIQDLKMSQMDVAGPKEMLVPLKKIPTVKAGVDLPKVKVIEPAQKDSK